MITQAQLIDTTSPMARRLALPFQPFQACFSVPNSLHDALIDIEPPCGISVSVTNIQETLLWQRLMAMWRQHLHTSQCYMSQRRLLDGPFVVHHASAAVRATIYSLRTENNATREDVDRTIALSQSKWRMPQLTSCTTMASPKVVRIASVCRSVSMRNK
jgi:hypothetical protein